MKHPNFKFAFLFTLLSSLTFVSCGGDSDDNDGPDAPKPEATPIDGYWRSLVETVNSSDLYMMTIHDGVYQISESHNGQNSMNGGTVTYSNKILTFTPTYGTGIPSYKFTVTQLSSTELSVTTNRGESLTFTKWDSWDFQPSSSWTIDNSIITGIWQPTNASKAAGYIFYDNGTGVEKKIDQFISEDDKFIYSYHSFNSTSGEVWYTFLTDPKQTVHKLSVSISSREEGIICWLGEKMYRRYNN